MTSDDRLGNLDDILQEFQVPLSTGAGGTEDDGDVHPSPQPLPASSLPPQHSQGKNETFTPDLLAAFRSFDCAKATRQHCSLKASKEVPFSLGFLDGFWKEAHGGNLPSFKDDDVKAYALERWKDLQDTKALKAMEIGLPPPFPEPPTQDGLKKMYVPNLDRRQFYCWKIRSDPEFCRLLKVKAMAVAGPNKKGKTICARLGDCLRCWAEHGFTKAGLDACSRTHKCMAVMPYFGVDLDHEHARHRFAGLLYLIYTRVGGKVSRADMKAKGGLLRYLAALLKPSYDVSKTSDSPIDLTVDPADEKIRQAFCEGVAAEVEAKATITFPPLDLPPAQYRAEIDRIFGRFAYPTPTFRDGCQWNPLKLTKLTRHQKFMGVYMTPKNPAKGILMDHAAGTGKTCAAVAALSNFVTLQGKGDKEGWKVIWVTRPKLVPDVGDAVYGLGCLKVLRDAIRDNAQTFGNAKTFIQKLNYARDNAKWGELESDLGHGFNLKTNVLKYSQFVNAFTYTGRGALPGILKTQYAADLFRKGADPIRKTLLILDEAHNLFNTTDLPASELTYMDGKKTGQFGQNIPGREHIINLVKNSYRVSGADSCRLILATATPMTKSPVDAFRLLNLLIPDPKNHLPDSIQSLINFRTKVGSKPFVDEQGAVTEEARQEFKQRTNGIISYFAGNRNPEYFAMKEFHIVDVPVTQVQEHYLKECVQKHKKRAPRKQAASDKNKLWGNLKKKLGLGPKEKEFMEGGDGDGYGEVFHESAGTPRDPQKDKEREFFEGGAPLTDYGEVFHEDLPKAGDLPQAGDLPKALPLTGGTQEDEIKVKKEKRATRVKSVAIPDGLTKAARKKVQTCMRNKSIMAVMRGKLLPTDREAEALRDAHHAKEREREAKERQAYVKKHGLSDAQMENVEAWKKWEAMEDEGHPGPKPKPVAGQDGGNDGNSNEDLRRWEAKEAKRKAKMDAKPPGRKPSKAMLAKYDAMRRGEFGDAVAFRQKPTPKMKPVHPEKRFNFNFDGKSQNSKFTPGILKEALVSYGPKVQALLDKIADLDAQDMKTHGRLFKHSIYTDTAGDGYGSKIVAAAFMAFGFQMACSYKKVIGSDGKPERNAAKELILELEPPEKTVGKCKGNIPPEPDTFAKGHTFCVLSSTAMDYFLDGKVERDTNPSVTKATTDLYNSSENDAPKGEGKLVRFIILDSGFKEGVSLSNVRYAHLLEPPIMEASLKQAVARSIRFCKSTLLKAYTAPPEGWWVDVYIFRSVFPAFMDDPDRGTKEEPSTVHQAIMDSLSAEEVKESRMMASFDNLLKESAVDYALNEAILNYSPPGIKMGLEDAAKALRLV